MTQEPAPPAQQGPNQPGRAEPRHGLRLLIMWLVASAICCPIVYFVWGPHLPPGDMSSSAANQQFDLTVLGTIATPVLLGVLIYFGYALTFWRAKDDDEADGPPIHGNTRIQVTWISVTSAIVLGLFIFGTVELWTTQGAGAGEGPQPIWKPDSSNILQVQVIGQQWAWTYRYPQFGGFETTQLELPVGEPVQFNVTSLDVIHGFWAYQLHHAEGHRLVRGPLRRALRAVARRDVRLRQGRLGVRLPDVGTADAGTAGCGDQVAAAVRHDLRPHRRRLAGQGPGPAGDRRRGRRLLQPQRP
jgi:heme/copper-type cytochrome/quinol oxidase subunit 2